MKTLGHSLLSASVFVAALLALHIQSCAGQEHAPAMQVQGLPVAKRFVDVNTQQGIVSPADPDVEVLVSAGPKGLAKLTDRLLHDPSTAEQARVAEAIGVLAYRNPGAVELPKAVPALALAAESKDLRVRVFALQGLAAIGEAASNTIPLLVRSSKDADMNVRMCAAEALGRIGMATPQTMGALKSGMSDPSGDVRITAVQALYKIGQPASNSIPVLVQLTKDESVSVRCAAVETLGRVGANSPEAVAALKSAQYDASEVFVRPLARQALKTVEANRE